MTRNVGKIANQGVELAVNGIPVRTKDFEWGLGFTFSKNWSEVKELWDDVTEYKLTSSYQVGFRCGSRSSLWAFSRFRLWPRLMMVR